MVNTTSLKKITEWAYKYKYVIGILLVGVLLMLMPDQESGSASQVAPSGSEDMPTLNQCLSEILSQIDGAGKVEVLLTVSTGEETIYQTDEEYVTGDHSGSTKVTTVIVTDAERNQTGLIQKINPPKYLGAIVVCQGADRAVVRLSIIEAVANATGLGTDKISVLKMK